MHPKSQTLMEVHIIWQFPKLQAISISLKPADAIPLTDAQKRTGDCFRQEFGSPALPFAQKRLYLRPQHLNRIHNGVVWRQIPQLYACGVICVVCPRRSATAFYSAATCEAPHCRFSACVPPYGRQYICSRRIFLRSPRRCVFFCSSRPTTLWLHCAAFCPFFSSPCDILKNGYRIYKAGT